MIKIFIFLVTLSYVSGQVYEQPEPEPYNFAYTSGTDDGATMERSENQDADGRITGFYTLDQPDGSRRRVEYIADTNGFRARVTTNEMGTVNSFPADVIMESSAKGIVANYEPSGSAAISSYKPQSTKTNIRNIEKDKLAIIPISPVNQARRIQSNIVQPNIPETPVTEIRSNDVVVENPKIEVINVQDPGPIITQTRTSGAPDSRPVITEVRTQVAPVLRPIITEVRTQPAPVSRPIFTEVRTQPVLPVSRPIFTEVRTQPVLPVSRPIITEVRTQPVAPVVTEIRTPLATEIRKPIDPAPVVTEIRRPIITEIRTQPVAPAPVFNVQPVRPTIISRPETIIVQNPPVVIARQAPRQEIRTEVREVARPVLLQNQVRTPINRFVTTNVKPTRFSVNNRVNQPVRTISSIPYNNQNNGGIRLLNDLLKNPIYSSEDVQRYELAANNLQVREIPRAQAESTNTERYIRYYLVPVKNGQSLKQAIENFVSRSS